MRRAVSLRVGLYLVLARLVVVAGWLGPRLVPRRARAGWLSR